MFNIVTESLANLLNDTDDLLTIELALNLNITNLKLNVSTLTFIEDNTESLTSSKSQTQFENQTNEIVLIALEIEFNSQYLNDYRDLKSNASIDFIQRFKEFVICLFDL